MNNIALQGLEKNMLRQLREIFINLKKMVKWLKLSKILVIDEKA